jgi:hypothetical protein
VVLVLAVMDSQVIVLVTVENVVKVWMLQKDLLKQDITNSNKPNKKRKKRLNKLLFF